MRIDAIHRMDTDPAANEGAVVQGRSYRFTVLTPQLIRLEYDESGKFENRATQTIIDRNFPVPEYRVVDKENSLEIITKNVHLTYDKGVFSKNGLNIKVNGNVSKYRSVWRFGEPWVSLGGTARTLDESDGAVPLEPGLLSWNGFSIIDDSKSLVLEEDGWVAPGEKGRTDVYFLGYGRDYLACLKDFFKLCGPTPMLPRYALGNWWSRFYRYTDSSYRELIENFKREGVPFSVAVLDMDWHLTDIDPKYGSGWTGYTWNRDFFPEPQKFLGWLHEQGLHATLNVHPSDGVYPHEEMYTDMARELSVDYGNEDKIHFDITDPDFLKAYFKYLHHPNEDIGVDFWWIDWQQGSTAKIEGIDPLWMLNHFHFLDSRRNGKRPLTFSRYAGIGSHRYPIGFSGDTFATWATLDFQPYFTAAASNAGYGWWSHDIGGHMHGVKSDDMAARWIQFGVFSPIMRIHSSDNPFNIKEPWQYNAIAEQTMKRFLRLRHQLVPYIYTMNRRFHKEGEPLIQPMYYRNPEDGEAYEVPNEYYFGTDLIVCPITTPTDPRLNLGRFKAWLPDGTYFDFFSGRIYRGGRKTDLFRDASSIPVLVKAGSIIPMVAESHVGNATDNPADMELRIFAGGDGEFTLYEDNSWNSGDDNLLEAVTNMRFRWGEISEFIINAYCGNEHVIPEERNYTMKFFGLPDTGNITAYSQGKPASFEKKYYPDTNMIELSLEAIETGCDTVVRLETRCVAENDIKKQIFELLNMAQIEYDLKSAIFRLVNKCDKSLLPGAIQAMDLESNLLGALFEIITA